jgi:hypothetical protein
MNHLSKNVPASARTALEIAMKNGGVKYLPKYGSYFCEDGGNLMQTPALANGLPEVDSMLLGTLGECEGWGWVEITNSPDWIGIANSGGWVKFTDCGEVTLAEPEGFLADVNEALGTNFKLEDFPGR